MRIKKNSPEDRIGKSPPSVTWGFAFLPEDTAIEELWDQPVPLVRPTPQRAISSPWTYRRYFQALEKELSRDQFAVLRAVVGRIIGRPAEEVHPETVRLIAEKHGHYYHPVRIEVFTGSKTLRFVLNGALTEWGKALISQEVRSLIRLKQKYPLYPFLPEVYGFFSSAADADLLGGEEEEPLAYFLAQWFEGFHEFHWALVDLSGERRLRLWDGGKTPCFLSRTEEEQVFARASELLTCYYDPQTYEQIYPWHHGAGDFIVRIAGKEVEVRLISVRRYGALLEPGETSPEEALLFFFFKPFPADAFGPFGRDRGNRLGRGACPYRGLAWIYGSFKDQMEKRRAFFPGFDRFLPNPIPNDL